MSLHNAPSSTRIFSHRTAADWYLGSVGVGCAIASVSFAAYMIVNNPGTPDPRGSSQFGIFAQFDQRPQFARQNSGPAGSDDSEPSLERVRPAGAGLASVAGNTIDYTPTGSIGAVAGSDSLQRPEAPRPSLARETGQKLNDFVLRDVFDGKALVEGRHQLTLVTPGSTLDGAGTVLSVERQGSAWVVVTDKGTIEARSN